MERKAQRTRDRKILGNDPGPLPGRRLPFRKSSKSIRRASFDSRISNTGWMIGDRASSISSKNNAIRFFGLWRTGPFHKKEWLLDLAIGSIFHEAMKLRENIYQLEVYRPKYLQYNLKAGKTDYEKDYLMQFEKIISRAEQGVTEGMEETRSLFQDAKAQLLDFFKASAENPYLVRFLLEHQPLLEKVYGKEGAREVFRQLFQNGFFDAYRVAGQSYLDSEHYDLSSLYFLKARKLHSRTS